MKLHSLHIAERNNPGIERKRRSRAVVNRCIGGVAAVDAPIATSCDHGRLGHHGKVRAGSKASCNDAVATRAIVYE